MWPVVLLSYRDTRSELTAHMILPHESSVAHPPISGVRIKYDDEVAFALCLPHVNIQNIEFTNFQMLCSQCHIAWYEKSCNLIIIALKQILGKHFFCGGVHDLTRNFSGFWKNCKKSCFWRILAWILILCQKWPLSTILHAIMQLFHNNNLLLGWSWFFNIFFCLVRTSKIVWASNSHKSGKE